MRARPRCCGAGSARRFGTAAEMASICRDCNPRRSRPAGCGRAPRCRWMRWGRDARAGESREAGGGGAVAGGRGSPARGDSAAGRSTRVFREEHSAELAKAAATVATALEKGRGRAAARAEAAQARGHRHARAGGSRAARQRLDRGAAGDRAPPRGGREGERAARRGARVKLKSILAVALGILSAIGGFVDIGDIVFNTQAGAIFGYQLLWVVVVGVVGIIVYSEMCGRVSAVSKRPVFDLVRERAGFGAGARDADRVPDRQPDDVRGRGRRRRDLLPAALGPALPPAHPARGRGARPSAPGCSRSSGSSASSATRASGCSCSRSRRSSSTPIGARSPTASCPDRTREAASRSTSTSSSACWAPR